MLMHTEIRDILELIMSLSGTKLNYNYRTVSVSSTENISVFNVFGRQSNFKDRSLCFYFNGHVELICLIYFFLWRFKIKLKVAQIFEMYLLKKKYQNAYNRLKRTF